MKTQPDVEEVFDKYTNNKALEVELGAIRTSVIALDGIPLAGQIRSVQYLVSRYLAKLAETTPLETLLLLAAQDTMTDAGGSFHFSKEELALASPKIKRIK